MRPMLLIITVIAGLFSTAISYSAFGEDKEAEKSNSGPDVLSKDITQGNVRVVLMSVGQVTVFPNDNRQEFVPGGRLAAQDGVPCFTVTLMLEWLGEGPRGPNTVKEVELWSDGKQVKLINEPGGVYQQWFDYSAYQDFLDFTKPKVADPRRASVLRHVRFAALPKLEPFDLGLKAGFGDEIHNFQFDSIRVQGARRER